ncbi:hypothetical protein OO009_05175 [Flavobacteriaceae bacterium KMM 6897]|nr:hypothetical protein [Flavobacteriaceae bacterium KMM 6897]MEB8345790.1 hypothetical protein [Flavobacteriaceae bacterium KMM 6898]
MKDLSWKFIGTLFIAWIPLFFIFPQIGEIIHMLPLASGYLTINKLITGSEI